MVKELRLNLRTPRGAIRGRVVSVEAGKAGTALIPGCPQHLQSGIAASPQVTATLAGLLS